MDDQHDHEQPTDDLEEVPIEVFQIGNFTVHSPFDLDLTQRLLAHCLERGKIRMRVPRRPRPGFWSNALQWEKRFRFEGRRYVVWGAAASGEIGFYPAEEIEKDAQG
ncbi:MAG: hypothetical protein P9M14_06615 [Candidatus Alcyoniella australis]|nr:hypothetical protein [Candidatus Alcyoniella australis]